MLALTSPAIISLYEKKNYVLYHKVTSYTYISQNIFHILLFQNIISIFFLFLVKNLHF